MSKPSLKSVLSLGALILTTIQISSCAMAPIGNSPSGRTLGKGKFGIDGGGFMLGTNVIPIIKLSFGVLDNLDLGFQTELFSYGVFLKFALLNPKTNGISLSLTAAGGVPGAGVYFYGGPTLGVKLGFIEPYGIARFNYVNFGTGSDSGGLGSVFGSYQYFSFVGGLTLWPTKEFGINGEVTFFHGDTGSSQLVGPAPTASILLRF